MYQVTLCLVKLQWHNQGTNWCILSTKKLQKTPAAHVTVGQLFNLFSGISVVKSDISRNRLKKFYLGKFGCIRCAVLALSLHVYHMALAASQYTRQEI